MRKTDNLSGRVVVITGAVDRNRAVAPIATEAHLMYVLSRGTPPLARWAATRLAELTK